ncbi:MAG: hypothetical protein EP338_01880 [Bacteroidetes bacterium]|nr:MAG: hypothetical protein EP338_01880 [Bacteroidota bacterium]
MKKFLLGVLACGALSFTSMAQSLSPTISCQNDGALEARIDAIEAQGWVEVSRSFNYIYYFIQPEAPYQIGTLNVTFVPQCDPGEPCPEIARLYQEVAYQQNDNICLWKPAN